MDWGTRGGVWRGALWIGMGFGLGAVPASAQLEDNLSTLTSDQARGYLAPFTKGLSAALNSGIFRTGSVPAAGLNFTLDLKGVYADFSEDDVAYLAPALPGYAETEVPTVIGDTHSVQVTHESSRATFTYPGGFDMQYFGVAVPQLAVGSFLGTRAILRYISLSLGDDDLGDFEMLGIGGQHSVSRYLPGMPVDLAVGAMWQKFEIGKNVIDAEAFALHLTGSKKFGVGLSVEPYAGIGIDSFDMRSEYDIGAGDTLEVEFSRENDFHFNLGASVSLGFVKAHGEFYTAAETGFAGGLSLGN